MLEGIEVELQKRRKTDSVDQCNTIGSKYVNGCIYEEQPEVSDHVSKSKVNAHNPISFKLPVNLWLKLFNGNSLIKIWKVRNLCYKQVRRSRLLFVSLFSTCTGPF